MYAYTYILPFEGHGRFNPLLGRPICMKVPVMDKQSIRSLVDIYIQSYVDEHRISAVDST
jgi:hypothetical protein